MHMSTSGSEDVVFVPFLIPGCVAIQTLSTLYGNGLSGFYAFLLM